MENVRALFKHQNEAEQAVNALEEQGVDSGDISLMTPDQQNPSGMSESKGSRTGSFMDDLVKSGIPESEAQLYAHGLSDGGALVTVVSNALPAEQIREILGAAGALELDELQKQPTKDPNQQFFEGWDQKLVGRPTDNPEDSKR